ncbi:septum formation initiator family protein [Bacteroidota bacterium]
MGLLSKWIFEPDNDTEESGGGSKIMGRWSVFGLVFIGAMITLLYVDNVMRVDDFLEDIRKLKKKKDLIMNRNELLKTRLNDLQSPDRITKIAEEKLGMIKIDTPPEILPER